MKIGTKITFFRKITFNINKIYIYKNIYTHKDTHKSPKIEHLISESNTYFNVNKPAYFACVHIYNSGVFICLHLKLILSAFCLEVSYSTLKPMC